MRPGPSGCSVALWECARFTSYVYPSTPLTNNQASSFQSQGFEIGLHPENGCRNFDSYDDVAKVTADLLSKTPAERMEIPIMHPGRADVIGAGALILRVIMERAGMSSVIASEHDILDGIAYSVA